MRARKAPLILFLLTSLSCLGCDQLTKEVARVHLVGSWPIAISFATLDLALVENAGAFLGLGSWLPKSLRVLAFQVGSPLVLGWICLAFLRESRLSTRDVLALALVVGGGAGNWLDRVLREGMVTDFMRLQIGPVSTGIFNVADVGLIAGIVVLVAGTLSRRESAPEPGPEA